MLAQRIASAVVLASALIAVVLWLDTLWMALVLALPALLALREWLALSGARSGAQICGWLLLAVLVAAALVSLPAPLLHNYLLPAVSLCWLGAFCLLVLRPERMVRPAADKAATAVIALLAVAAAWSAIVYLHQLPQYGRTLTLLLFVLVWLVDGAAYVVGRAWGRAPLAPQISPAKTRVGALGALAAALLFALAGYALSPPPLAAWVALCVVCAGAAIGGDLMQSALKRRAGVKDSGTLIPGHGGVFDRIDGLLAAAPFYVVGIRLLQP